MYNSHFGFSETPFSLSPNPEFFCPLPHHQAALNVLLVSLRSGEGFVKITGEVGAGKTTVCRTLLGSLDEYFVTVHIPNPVLDAAGLRMALAEELGTELPRDCSQHYVLKLITRALTDHYQAGRKVLLIVDEAQALSTESLESLRLLTNLETNDAKLLQVVLFGQPELDERLAKRELRQLLQRVTFSYVLEPLTVSQLQQYITHRLTAAGYVGSELFSAAAMRKLHRFSRGTPRLVNVLCHKALLLAFAGSESSVSAKRIKEAAQNTESVQSGRGAILSEFLPGAAFATTAFAIALVFIFKVNGSFNEANEGLTAVATVHEKVEANPGEVEPSGLLGGKSEPASSRFHASLPAELSDELAASASRLAKRGLPAETAVIPAPLPETKVFNARKQSPKVTEVADSVSAVTASSDAYLAGVGVFSEPPPNSKLAIAGRVAINANGLLDLFETPNQRAGYGVLKPKEGSRSVIERQAAGSDAPLEKLGDAGQAVALAKALPLGEEAELSAAMAAEKLVVEKVIVEKVEERLLTLVKPTRMHGRFNSLLTNVSGRVSSNLPSASSASPSAVDVASQDHSRAYSPDYSRGYLSGHAFGPGIDLAWMQNSKLVRNSRRDSKRGQAQARARLSRSSGSVASPVKTGSVKKRASITYSEAVRAVARDEQLRAKELFHEVLIDDESHIEARQQLAGLYLQSKDFNLVERVLRATPKNQQNNPDIKLIKAHWYLAEGGIEKALSLLEKKSPSIPRNIDYYSLKASLLYELGRYSEARILYHQLLVYQPDSAKLAMGYGFSLRKDGFIDEARIALNRALSGNRLDKTSRYLVISELESLVLN